MNLAVIFDISSPWFWPQKSFNLF